MHTVCDNQALKMCGIQILQRVGSLMKKDTKSCCQIIASGGPLTLQQDGLEKSDSCPKLKSVCLLHPFGPNSKLNRARENLTIF